MQLTSLIAIFLLAVFPYANAEEDPFEQTKSDPPRLERSISKLPLSLTYQKKDGRHVYEIRGIYAVKHERFQDSDYLFCIPGGQSLKINHDDRTCTFTTTNELSYPELAGAIDCMAEQGIGNIPYWRELHARDLEPTEKFKRMKCTILAIDQMPPEALAWFDGPKNEELRIPLQFGGGEGLCSLYILEATSTGMSSSRFSVRILDPEGRVIWKEDQTAIGSVKVALSGESESPMHKIWLLRNDNGVKSTFVITSHFEPDPIQTPPPTSR